MLRKTSRGYAQELIFFVVLVRAVNVSFTYIYIWNTVQRALSTARLMPLASGTGVDVRLHPKLFAVGVPHALLADREGHEPRVEDVAERGIRDL